ncbi:ABC transporter permease [Sinisalibacter aestuarii]|nr:ABC transporter permease [Sinisalibacter aestuarii]
MPERPPSSEDMAEIMPLSPARQALLQARGHVGLLVGLFVLLVVMVSAIFAPIVAPHDPYVQEIATKLSPPVWQEGGDWAHILGTDGLGRDILSRLIYGARVTLIAGVGAAIISGIIGTIIGMCGGYFGGRVDDFVVFLINVKLAMPGILIALSLVSIFGGSLVTITLILGLLFWDRFAVVARTTTQQLSKRDFITAAEVAGASSRWILMREMLPNLMNQIIVVASLEMALAILVEATLSFLGLGIQPPTPSWGLMISEGRTLMFAKPYLIMIPGIAIFALVVAINLIGDGLRDITSPEGKG